MATVLVVYHQEEPNFPATAQHPDAVRYHIGDKWVDAIGGQPTQEEIDAVLNPKAPIDSADAMLKRQRDQAIESLDKEIAKLPASQQVALKLIQQILERSS